MLENRVPAPRAALLQYRVPPCAHRLVRIRALRRRTMRHATTSCWIMNDTVLVCICKMSRHTYAGSALRRHVMLHIIHYHHSLSSAFRHAVYATAFRLE